jgi:hypothetical protein
MATRQLVPMIAIICIASLQRGSTVVACGGDGGYITARFWYDTRPSTGDEAFVSGQLGIMGPSLPAPRLWIAYRYLAGIGVLERERGDVLSALDPQNRFSQRDLYNVRAAVSSWMEARSRVPGIAELETPSEVRTRIVPVGERQYR